MEDRKDTLPQILLDYIDALINSVGTKKVQLEVTEELTCHFMDAMHGSENDRQKEDSAKELIENFGDAKMLGKLIKQGKKRCRPLWQKVLIRTMQIAAVLLLCIIARAAYLATGTPVISVDYVQWINDHVKNGRSDDLNALGYYKQAIELSKEVPEKLQFGTLTPEQYTAAQWDAVEEFLAHDAKALDALRQGAAKPHYWNVYESTHDTAVTADLISRVMTPVMTTLSGYRNMARKLCNLQIPWLLHIGDLEAAIDDSIVLHRFAQHMCANGLLIEQLVGIAIQSMACKNTLDMVDNYRIDSEKLEAYQQQLEDICQGDQVFDMTAEKAFWYDFIQRSFTDDGKGSGRPIKQGVAIVSKDLPGALKGFVVGYPDRREVLENSEQYFTQIANLTEQTPRQLIQSGSDQSKWDQLASGYSLLDISGAGLGKVAALSWRTRTEKLAIPAILAIVRYQQDNGDYPASLNELVKAGYLKALPQDPYSNEPLRYKLLDNDFTLYSVGEDMTDNKGQIGTKNGKPFKWADNGDWIFWPVQE